MEANDFLKRKIEEAIPSLFKNVNDLARRAGVPQPILSKFLSEYKGKQSISFSNAWKIMEALSITDRFIDTLETKKEEIQEKIKALEATIEYYKEQNALLRGENRILERLVNSSNPMNIEQRQHEKEQIQRVEIKK